MTVALFFKETTMRLSKALGNIGEGEAAARIIFEDVAGYDRKYIFMHGEREIADFMQAKIYDVVKRVEAGEPVQYAVGHARFMGNDYKVSRAVLIPRPETEGLVDMIIERFGSCSDLKILDVGTGSGCIAISLARALPFSMVKAVDISATAIDIARENAHTLNAKVQFEQLDIQNAYFNGGEQYDIIVSNPPYIAESEKDGMDSRVLDYEPSIALFVPDNDPLVFYRAIAHYTREALTVRGELFFEINALYPEEARQLLVKEGFDDVDIIRDYRGKYRYVRARKTI